MARELDTPLSLLTWLPVALAARRAVMRPHAGVGGLVPQVVARRLAPKLAAVPQAAPLVGLDAVLRRHVRPHGGGARRVGKVAALLGAEEALGRLALGVVCLVVLHFDELLADGPYALDVGDRREWVGGAAAAAVPQARRLALRIVDAAAAAVYTYVYICRVMFKVVTETPGVANVLRTPVYAFEIS